MMAIRSKVTAIQKLQRNGRISKSDKVGAPRRGVDSLTCGEAEVDAILSEGEST